MRAAIGLLASLLAAGAHAAGDSHRMPAADAPEGWKPAGPARVFTGSGLYGHIDGGAEIFFEFGFEEATVQRYARGGETVDLELYRMADPTAALGIYLHRCGNRCDPPGTHPELPAYTTRGRTQLAFVRDRFLAVATADVAGGRAAAALAPLASALARRLPPERAAEPAASLEPGWVPGSLRLIRGPIALQSIITLGEGDVLQLGGRLTAAAADYPAAGGQAASTLVAVDYPDGAAAGAAFSHLRGGLDPEIHVVRENERRLVFRDYRGAFGSAAVAGRRLELRVGLASDPGPTP